MAASASLEAIFSSARVAASAIHESGKLRGVIAGPCGSQALAWLLSVPGASGTVLSGRVTYSMPSTSKFMGEEPEQYASVEAARKIATSAYVTALKLTAEEAAGEADDAAGEAATSSVFGIGCTGALRSHTVKRGDHRVFVAMVTGSVVATDSIVLAKGTRERWEEDLLAAQMVMRRLAITAGVDGVDGVEAIIDLGLKDGEEVVSVEVPNALGMLLRGESPFALHTPEGDVVPASEADVPEGSLLVSGSFNPLHTGHVNMARCIAGVLAERGRSTPPAVFFELAAINADKPPIPEYEIRRRTHQFLRSSIKRLPVQRDDLDWLRSPGSIGGVLVSSSPLFVEKAELFPGTRFVVGVDTAERLLDPKYYGDSHASMLASMAAVRNHGCSFVVVGRVELGSDKKPVEGGVFKTLEAVDVPPEVDDLFVGISEAEFRFDMSSSQLRASAL